MISTLDGPYLRRSSESTLEVGDFVNLPDFCAVELRYVVQAFCDVQRDLKPAPRILARPFPVSTADSTLSTNPGPGVAGPGDAAEFERLHARSLEEDLEPCADSANA
jgi:hypothetical protein